MESDTTKKEIKKYSFEYPHNNLVYVTEETVETTPNSFSKENGISEKESVHYFFSFVEYAQTYLDRNCIVLDVGAQSGLYSLYAKFLHKTYFLAFEPFPSNFKCLEDNLILNDVKNVHAHQIALGNTNERKTLYLGTHNGEHTLGEISVLWKPTGKLDVEVHRLDSIIPLDFPVDFIKIDTEGYEYFILQGGESILKKWKPQIFLEVNPSNMKQCGLEVETLETYLKSLGYKKINEINGENHHYMYFHEV